MAGPLRLIAALAAACTLAACQQVQTTEGGAIGVERKQSMLVLLSPAQVDQMAAQGYNASLAEAKGKGKLNRDAQATARVRAVSQRLIPQVAVFRKDALGWKWEVNVEDSPELNAYCAPGGKIMFYTGIIDKLKLSDDEIAAIMGHEMAHALREHGRERMSKVYAQQMGAQLVSAFTRGRYDQYLSLGLDGFNLALNLPNSRDNESEADAMGIELAARGGYDPRAAISLWQKMSAASQGQPPQFLSTHPSNQTRITDLQANMPKVLPLYDAARGKR
ncbi:M48 family metallopeptidase [Chitinimonas koreensis]|uniref:M48 family metallopeptidase n=1 Tax=Chitinimonas koreensis TaxID=356302 RepID=UPI000412921C|nr:M48 family metallopeptidase [Chitinimonas koreensis]QNM96551.1 M48 family metallopeptidase [Chitinimonas koreensis]